MRSLLLILALAFASPILLNAQSPSINKFYRNHKKMDDVRNVKLPGWLIKFGSNIAKKHVDGDMEKEAIGMAKSIKKMRLLVAENPYAIQDNEVNDFIHDLEHKDKFLPLVSIRKGGQNIHIMMEEKRDLLRGLLIMVDSDDTFMMLSIKTKIHLEDIADLIITAMNGDEWEMEEVEVEDEEIILPKA